MNCNFIREITLIREIITIEFYFTKQEKKMCTYLNLNLLNSFIESRLINLLIFLLGKGDVLRRGLIYCIPFYLILRYTIFFNTQPITFPFYSSDAIIKQLWLPTFIIPCLSSASYTIAIINVSAAHFLQIQL